MWAWSGADDQRHCSKEKVNYLSGAAGRQTHKAQTCEAPSDSLNLGPNFPMTQPHGVGGTIEGKQDRTGTPAITLSFMACGFREFRSQKLSLFGSMTPNGGS